MIPNPCNICNSETEALAHPKNGLVYHSCKRCEFIFLDQKHRISKEEEFTIYSHHNNSIEDSRYVAYFKAFLADAFFPYQRKPGKGLDFGSGPSPVLSQILERDYGIQTDIYDKYYATERVYEGKTYEFITSTEVVEHLEDPLQYFTLFKEHTKAGGFIAIMTLFHNGNKDDFFNWHYIRDRSHISFYTEKTMAYIADKLKIKMVFSNGTRYTTFVVE
jgi:hypothetical protein